MDIIFAKEAKQDLSNGADFYERQQSGIGQIYWDSILSDLKSLQFYAGIHPKQFGLYKMLAKRYLFAIYYQVETTTVIIHAILPMKRDPGWFKQRLSQSKFL
jgi:plasmid stabilization system protein ParE